MDTLQSELDESHPEISISILGINQFSKASGNAVMTMGRDLPWLQDTEEQDVWVTWGVGFRDVIIVDAQGVYYATYNLTTNDLADADNVAALRALLLEAAGSSD